MDKNTHFQFRLADILFDVLCCYESTKKLCTSYLAEGIPQINIRITDADIEAERIRLLSKKNPGDALEASTPQLLERLVLCRMVARALPPLDRVLFHGSCLTYDGIAVLFTAKSGTGKSTHTRLWRQSFGEHVTMLNDDKPFLHIGKDSVTAYGSPWTGKHSLGSNIAAPLKAICFVCRSEENWIEPADAREAFTLLLQQTFTPEEPQALLQTLALVERMSRNVPFYRLHCNMDPQAAQVALEGVSKKLN